MNDNERQKKAAWIHAAIERTGETATALARNAGLGQSTLTRFLGKPDAPMIKTATLNAVADAHGLPRFDESAEPVARSGGMGEEGEPFNAANADNQLISRAVAALTNDRPGVDPWVLKSDAITLAGYRPGDILIVNLNAKPEPGDVVCVQVYQWESGRADTRFRIFQPPYVIAASADHMHWKPLLIDNDRVIIRGRIEAMVRI